MKGQKIIESVDSKLPRVTGISLPKIQKPRDYVDEMLYVNQPPPTPCDVSVVTIEKHKFENDVKPVNQTEVQAVGENIQNIRETQNRDDTKSRDKLEKEDENKDKTNGEPEKTDTTLSQVVEVENVMTERKSLEIGPVKKVNFEDIQINESKNEETEKDTYRDIAVAEPEKEKEVSYEKNENVLFFITEDEETDDQKEKPQEKIQDPVEKENKTVESTDTEDKHKNTTKDVVEEANDTEESNKTVEDVIKVEISETEKKMDGEESEEEKPLTSEDYPFDGSFL